MNTGGGRRRQGRHPGFDDDHETRISKPVIEEDHIPTLDSESPPSVSSTSQPQRNLESTAAAATEVSVRRAPRYHRKPKWGSRNRRARGVKPQFVEKTEVGFSNSEVGSWNGEVGGFSFGERVNQEQEDHEESRDQEGEEKQENLAVKSGMREEKIDEMYESSKEVDDIVSRLVELQLGAEEPGLSEEQLRINDLSQEDEVFL